MARKMALLEESNSLRGLGPDDSSLDARVRSARRLAVASLVAAVLWGFGILSLVGMVAGLGAWTFLRQNAADSPLRWVALAGFVLGTAGLVATVVMAAPSVL